MTIKRLTPKGLVKRFIENHIAMQRQAIINNYLYVGEEALRVARTQHKYKRRTGNLASSIGYCILQEGKVIRMSDFEIILNGSKGAAEGRKFLNSLIKENSKGLVFIMVAGMNYAGYVEAMSLDVLESAEQLTKRLLPDLFKTLKL